jgi:hypothetical protein
MREYLEAIAFLIVATLGWLNFCRLMEYAKSFDLHIFFR